MRPTSEGKRATYSALLPDPAQSGYAANKRATISRLGSRERHGLAGQADIIRHCGIGGCLAADGEPCPARRSDRKRRHAQADRGDRRPARLQGRQERIVAAPRPEQHARPALLRGSTARRHRDQPFFLAMLGSILRTCAKRGYDLLTLFQQLVQLRRGL